MASLNAALDFLERKYGNPSQPPAGDGGMDPSAASTPRQGAQMIDFETPLPDWQPSAGAVDMPPEQDQAMVPLQDEEPAQDYAPQRVSRVEQGDTFNAALDFLTRKYGDPQQAATQQAVAEATTPTENLPVLKSDLANALGVLDYRDPQEGARRSQAAALGEILGLPEYEKVQLGAAPVNADGTVTIRRAQAVSPEAQAAADQQMALIQAQAAADLAPPSRPVEYYNRAERGARLGVEDVRSGFYSIVENFFKDQQNPYLYSSPQTAEADVPKIETRLAALQQRRTEFVKGDLGPNRDRISPFDQEISSLTGQLEKARQATTGEPVTENFLGSVSRASADLATEARENQSAIRTDYTDKQITPERDKEFWMTVADGLGRTVPTAGAAILNPYLGLAMGYTQVYSNAEQEFDQAAAQTGKPLDPAARSDYAHSQALLQTPFELVGDLALAKVARDSIASSGQALIRSIRGGDTTAVSSFVANLPRRAGQLGAAAAGETLITTPAQTIIEQKVAESAGVRDPISNAQLAANTGQAMKVAAAQSLLLGGGPVALETGVTTIADRLRRPTPPAQPPTQPAPMGTPSSPTAPPSSAPIAQPAPAEVPQNFTPISDPAPAQVSNDTSAPRTLGQVRAPQIAIDPAALDETFGPSTPIPPNTSTAPAAASGAPASTGSPDLITGEGASVSPTAVLPSPETTPAATAPRPFSDLMAENMKRKGEAGYIDFGVVQDFGQSIYQTGMDFAAWSGRMVQKFGETIRDVLSSLWQAVSGGQYLPQARERGSVNISPGTGPKPRKFGQSLQAAPGVAPEVKSRLTSLDYDPVSNAQTLANARARIDSAGSIDTAFTDLMGKPDIEGWQPTAEDYATGMELMAQLQNRSRHADAASIANMMATRATDQGRAIQALSMIGRLGPQGIELFAQSQLQAAATKPAKTDKQKANIQAKITEAGQFQGEIDKLRRNNTTAAIVANKDLIKSELPAGVDAVQVNIAIREAILGAPTPLAAQAATSSILTSQGLSDKGAARISGSIVRDFLKTTQDTRATVLQDLLATADSDRRLDKSKLGSLIRLNREGKLTDASLHAGMAKMLGIPHWSAEHSAKVRRILAQHEKATDPRIKLVKAAEALDVVYRDFMPPGFLDKVDTIQTIAMLLNTKTVGRNVIGNTLMATADLAADAVSVPMDALVSLGTGERTRTGLSLGERMMGLGAGVGDIKAGYDFARSEGRGRIGSIAEGVDTLVRLGRLQSSGKYNASDISALSGPTFTAPGFRHLESTLGLVLSISDRGFYESAFRASLDTRMKAAAANGNPMLAPDTDMVTAARMDAGRAIYQDDNAASRTLSDLRRALNRNKRWGIGSLLMKFTQVPGSILTRAVEFSPLGFINTAYQSLAPILSSSREFDQKAFTDSFSRALVGTTGLVATGYWLAHLGIISAGSDSKDEDKRNLNRAMGWGSYKLNVDALKRALMTGNFWTPQKRRLDDKVIGYDWAQPLSIGVAMGAYSRENQEAIKQDILAGKKQSLAATGLNWLAYAGGAATGAMNSLVEQPLLTGLNQFARDVGYDNIPGALLKTAADAPGTFIPTAARQWMQLTDNAVRETRDSSPVRQFINELKAQLPGQSQTLPPKYDIAGQPVERWAKDSNTLFNVLFNPSMVSYIKGSPALTEMSQVYKYTAEAGAIPNQVKPEFTVEGVKVRLTSEEISAMQKDMGALSIAALEKFVLSDPRYDKATWDIKAKAMTRALEKASTAAKYRILLSRPDLKTRAKQEYDAIQANRAATQSDMLAPAGP
jgi:hypothetical protein